MTFSGHDDIAL